jgi:5-methylcytosine-specific restriction endonuclease McrA
VVIERALDLLVDHLQRKRLGKTTRPRQVLTGHKEKPSGIANATRREVYERDGLQCTYVAEDGRRCEARTFLELDHAVAKALGGSNDSRNLRVRCRAHNQLAAEQAFGRERIEWIRRFRQKKSTTRILEKVRLALRGMGFRSAQAERAIATVARMHDPGEPPTLEQALREALRVATAA